MKEGKTDKQTDRQKEGEIEIDEELQGGNNI